MKPLSRLFLFFLCALASASALAAQEKPVLTDAAVRAFIQNNDAIGAALQAAETENDVRQMQDAFDRFWGSFAEFFEEDETDFRSVQTSYAALRDLQVPRIDNAFSGNGMSPGGYRSFIVIFAGLMIAGLEENFAEALEEGDFDSPAEVETVRGKIARMRSLLHPADLAMLKSSMTEFSEFFDDFF
jgi:hypothetical protein